ncbi:MAG: QueT transporter family protein [Clostridia bacterium]|nr:QueT transporter family protein [Clostridia bacterium]
MKTKLSALFLAQTAAVAAIYIVLTFLANALGLSSGAIQIRFSEVLCVLPIFMPAAIPGLFVGCILANALTGSIVIDIILGSIATLVGAIFTRKFKDNLFPAILSPILSNTIILPFVLKFAYAFEGSLVYFAFTIALGEIISCGFLGTILAKALKKRNVFK